MIKVELCRLTSIQLWHHWFSWLKPCFDFGFRLFIFLILLILFSFVSHAALHGTWLRTPTHPSPNTAGPSLPSPPSLLPLQPPPWFLFTAHHRRCPGPPSRQLCQIDEEHGRCSPHAKQTPPIWPPTWLRTGTGAQCRYTPLTWSTNSPLPNLCGARSVSWD